MNSLQNICAMSGFSWSVSSCCCPFKGYKGESVYAVIRASSTMRFIFSDGGTLTVGHKTRYATFPRKSALIDIASEAIAELSEKHPLTKNRYVTENL